MSDDAELGTMRAAIAKAVDDYLQAKGGGFRIALVYAADVVDSDGTSALYLGSPDGQETYKSLGLVSYLEKWFDAEAQELMARSCGAAGCSCEDED